MKNLLTMYLFRTFVISLLGFYIWINVDEVVLKCFLAIVIIFIISYFWHYLKPLMKPFWLFGLITIFVILLVIFIFQTSKTEREICLVTDGQNYQVRVIRDTILQNDINVTLGKVQSDCLKGKLVLIRSSIDEVFKIDDVLITAKPPEFKSNMYSPFDMIFFGKINYQLNFVAINNICQADNISFQKIISKIRDRIDENIKLSVGIKNYNLVSMWLLGKSKINDQALSELFKNLGISHILVISGTHLSILFNIVGWILIVVMPSYGWYLLFLVIFLIFFLFLTGFSSSILRATLFWLFLIIGKFNGKIINYTNILLMVLLIFFIINPLTIVYDVGFHLSFLSIVALVYVLPIIQRYVKHQNEKINLMINVFNATISITVLLLPYLVYRFSEFNVLSVIFNIFLIPLSGLILSAAFVTAMVSFWHSLIAQFFGWMVYWLINIFLLILNWLENININVNFMVFNSIFLIIIYYLLLVILIIDFYKKNKELTINI